MKAILINVKNKTVTDVTYDSNNSLKEWYKLMDCGMVEVAMELENDDKTGNSIMVDEEGLLSINSNTKFFSFEKGHQPFAGNGLIVGINYETGETIDVSITADEVRNKVKFHTLHEVQTII